MIRIELDVMLARRKMTLTELSRRLDIALPNLSILKNVSIPREIAQHDRSN